MRARILLLFGLIAFFTSALAQENFMPGYILSENGDTLRGYVDYRNWDQNPDIIQFKSTLTDRATSYSAMNIQGFAVADEQYVAGDVQIEVSPFETRDLNLVPDLSFKDETLFLQTVVKGTKSLYYVKTKAGKDQFYISQGSGFQLLIYKRYLKDNGGAKVIAENKKFIGQLTLYLGDCPKLMDKLQMIDYSKPDLESIFLSYYSCIGQSQSFLKRTEKAKVGIGVLAGMSFTFLNFSSSEGFFTYLTECNFPASIDFAGGLYLEVVMARNLGKLSWNNELLWSYYKMTGTYSYTESADNYLNIETNLGFGYVNFNTMMRYRFPVNKLGIFADIGVSNGFMVAETNEATATRYISGSTTIKQGAALDDVRIYELGFLGGCGVNLNHLSAELRYVWGNGMSSYNTLSSVTNKIFLLVGYRF